ncbi:helix-turn-helix domain-containing protein [Bacillaceae bacterium Marseille-Q3522]|nr:helix-turn-helix domain-containing protein [Bacillaceae bacterium Marseille-Q3522]
MDYMSAKEAALKWGISKRRVQTLCAKDRIKGASKVGMVWVIPKNAEKPDDERIKINKN